MPTPHPANQHAARQLRATQGFVAHMTFCWRHPSLTALEVGWRWLFGVPFLFIVWGQIQQILLQKGYWFVRPLVEVPSHQIERQLVL